MAYFGGDLSRELEASGGLEAFAREALVATFGAQLAGRIRGTLVTGWDNDPWAGGSYTAARPGAARQREVLASPVSPRLLFAGEACHAHHYGTIYGAWQSGVAAARHLIDTLRSSP
jgi:monoamine oxidase